MEGLCLVISPLIALMKDQVENLNARGIKAAAIVSGMSRKEIDWMLDNCIYGQIKFLYVSPERLVSELFLERLKKMKINMIAVDEAHCISQWGYDFRPPYMQIADIRTVLPDVPVLALTATATPEVVEDIQDKLGFKQQNAMRKSFERSNIAYIVLKEEDKNKRMLRIMSRVPGTGLVYVRNRKRTREIAQFLMRNNVSADFYHAGLNQQERAKKQAAWKAGTTRVIVATNAFGMGIDKADVRFVINFDLPDSLEAYFQEAGRAGRDEKKAYGVLLINENDIRTLEQNVVRSFPPIEFIRRVYQGLINHLQIAFGAGLETTHEIDLFALSERISEKPAEVYRALAILELDGYISLSSDSNTKPRLHITLAPDALYNFQVANGSLDDFIKLLLRSYTGLFEDFVNINLQEIGKRFDSSVDQIHELLTRLDSLGVVSYSPKTELPRLTFTLPCQDPSRLAISKQAYDDRKKRALEKAKAAIDYANSTERCRSVMLLEYFGEKGSSNCGQCDYCLKQKSADFSEKDFEALKLDLERKIGGDNVSLQELTADYGPIKQELVSKVLRWMVDHDIVEYDGPNKVRLTTSA